MFQEERTFTLRFSLEATFPEDYEGEEDDYAWAADWERKLKPELLRLIFDHLRRQPAWAAHVRNRGSSPVDQVEIVLERKLAQELPGLG